MWTACGPRQPHAMADNKEAANSRESSQLAAQICAAMCGSIRQLSVGMKLELPNRLAYLYPFAWRFTCQW